MESTIIDLSEDMPRLLRPGGITAEQLYSVIGEFVIDKAVTARIYQDTVVKAPGMKYRHYAPDCRVQVLAYWIEKESKIEIRDLKLDIF